MSLDLTDMVAGQGGYKYALTIIDNYSRFVQFYKLRNKTTRAVINAFGRYVGAYNPPQMIITDNGLEFNSEFFNDFCAENGIKHVNTTPYNPRGNAYVERMHATQKKILAALCNGFPHRWPDLLDKTQLVMNTAVHTSIGQQPYVAFFSRYPRRNTGFDLPQITNSDEDMLEVHKLIRDTNKKMVEQYLHEKNKNRKNERVEVDSLVWVKKEVGIANTSRKLNRKWGGPYQVVQVLREGGAYVLRNVWTGVLIQRTAEKIKRCSVSEQVLLEEYEPEWEESEEEEEEYDEELGLGTMNSTNDDCVIDIDEQMPVVSDFYMEDEEEEEEMVERDLIPRMRRKPRRWIEEI